MNKLRRNLNPKDFAIGCVSLSFALLCLLSLVSHEANDQSLSYVTNTATKNILGNLGSYASDFFLQSLGYASVLFVLVPGVWGIKNMLGYNIRALWLRFLFFLMAVIALSIGLVPYHFSKYFNVQIISSGGTTGSLIWALFPILAHPYAAHAALIASGLLVYLALDIRVESVYMCLRIAALASYKSFQSIFKSLASACRKLLVASPEPVLAHDSKAETEKEPISKKTEATPSRKFRQIVVEGSNYDLPSPELLQCHKQNKINISEYSLKQTANDLIKTLDDFGVQGKIDNYFSGPVVTLYELEPSAGTKSSRVISLADDIARTMRALSTRVSIMPGKNSLGIELPNSTREMVYLKELVESDDYINSHSKLPIVLGKDIGGSVVIADLSDMPHLLVAGTTGSGKSVAINTMILSLLFKHTPDTCRFIMIDPKMLELSVYDGIPHLLAPVVTEAHKAVSTMKWVVKEMENRYRLMSHLGVRNIHGYNQKIKEGVDLKKEVQIGFDEETGDPIYETINIDNTILPFIVVIVDEMADLMIVSGKEIEASVQRVAQMARAAGIHIIMATQRPSVDVITGVIKANFSSRIAFQVSSKIDSRTILGEMGAEQLLGKGDMLYMSSGNKIRRIHGPFVGDAEISSLVSFWKAQGKPTYRTDIILGQRDEDDSAYTDFSANSDNLYDQAVSFVRKEKRVSTSYIQRQFKIGYNRAATIVERMEKEGIISEPNHVGKREVLVDV